MKVFKYIIGIFFILFIIYGILSSILVWPCLPFLGDLLIALAALLTGSVIVENVSNKHVNFLKSTKNWVYKYSYLVFLKYNNPVVYKQALDDYITQVQSKIDYINEKIKEKQTQVYFSIKEETQELNNAQWLLNKLKLITQNKISPESLMQELYENRISDILARYKLNLYTNSDILAQAANKEQKYQSYIQKKYPMNFKDEKLNFLEE